MMPDYHIGSLDDAGKAALANTGTGESEPDTSPTFLNPKQWKRGILSAKTDVSWDTKIFTFKLSFPEQKLGLPTGQHLMLRLTDPVTREVIIRSYTPISEQDDEGKLDILIKVYFDTADRPGGKMTQALHHLPIGHFIDIKGPTGHFEYKGLGRSLIHGDERRIKKFIMICGGSGVTPIFQVLRAVVREAGMDASCVVLNGNRLEEDILCRQDLDDYAERFVDKCQIIHTLSNGGDTWKGLRGRVGKELLHKHAAKDVIFKDGVEDGQAMVLICGPSPMEQSAKTELLAMGWSEHDMLFF